MQNDLYKESKEMSWNINQYNLGANKPIFLALSCVLSYLAALSRSNALGPSEAVRLKSRLSLAM